MAGESDGMAGESVDTKAAAPPSPAAAPAAAAAAGGGELTDKEKAEKKAQSLDQFTGSMGMDSAEPSLEDLEDVSEDLEEYFKHIIEYAVKEIDAAPRFFGR